MFKSIRLIAKGIWLLLFFPDEFEEFDGRLTRIRYRMHQLRREQAELYNQLKEEKDPELLKPLHDRWLQVKAEGARAWEQL